MRCGGSGPPAPPKATPTSVGNPATVAVQRREWTSPPAGAQPNRHSCFPVPASRTYVFPSGASTAHLSRFPPQAIPAGELVTVPDPAMTTTSRSGSKLATSDVSPATAVQAHERVLQPAALHPANVRPEAGAALAVTRVPGRYASEQPRSSTEESHVDTELPVSTSMPGGDNVTAPPPFANTWRLAAGRRIALIVVSWKRSIRHSFGLPD
jgi:hypothetical protein